MLPYRYLVPYYTAQALSYYLALLMDPPSRFDFIASPYFLLPQRKFLSSSRNTANLSPNTTRSIKAIYGKVELMSDRKQADFLLRLMAHSDVTPNFEAMASALGLPGEGAV